MSLKHYTKFHQSEVMRELERIAVRKGHFDPTPEEEIEAAAAKLKTARLKPTDNLFNDIMQFASALRAKGFAKQADEIEQKALVFKTAERHLYRVFDEDGDDFLDYAHPEGEFDVAPAQEGNGKVETTLTKHKRIMDVVQANPTGKLAAAVRELVSIAQELTPVEQERDANQKKLNDMFSSLKISLGKLRDWVKQNFPNQGAIGDQIADIGDKFGVTLGLDATQYTAATKQMTNSVQQVKDLLGSIKQPADTRGAVAFGQISMAPGSYEWLANNLARQVSEMIPGKTGKEITGEDRPVDAAKLSSALKYYQWSLDRWSDALKSYQDAGSKDDASAAVKNVEALRSIVSILNAAIKSGTMLALRQALKPYMQVMDEDGIVQDAYQTSKDTQAMLEKLKTSGRRDAIVKDAIGLAKPPSGNAPPPPPPPPPPGAAPAAPAKPGGPGAGMAKGPAAPAAPAIPTEEKQAVRVMQNLMTDLSNGLTQQAANLTEKLQMSAEEIQAAARRIADTGIGSYTAADGIWGPKTQSSLGEINILTARSKVPNPSLDIGEGGYKRMSTEEAIQKANSNAKSLVQLMGNLGLGQYQQTQVPGVGKISTPLDNVPTSLSRANVTDMGKTPLFESQLESLQSFLYFLTGQHFNVAASAKRQQLEKLALEVVGQTVDPRTGVEIWQGPKPVKPPDWVPRTAPSWVRYNKWRGSFDAPRATAPAPAAAPASATTPAAPAAPTAQTTPADTVFGTDPMSGLYSLTAAQFDQALQWFYTRAGQQYNAARTPGEGKAPDPQEVQRKQDYYQAMGRLFAEWRQLATNAARKGQLTANTPISPITLGQLGASGSGAGGLGGPGAGMARGRPGAGGYDIGGPGGGPDNLALSEPPFTYNNRRPRRLIDLQFLESTYNPGPAPVSQYLAMQRVDKLSLRSPEEFASDYASDRSKQMFKQNSALVNKWVQTIADRLSRELQSIFSDWADTVETMVRATRDPNVEALIAANFQELREWQSWLARMARISGHPEEIL